jgi:hypothetical protein
MHAFGSASVCAETDELLVGTGERVCIRDVSYHEASQTCMGAGARLCSLEELLANEAYGTGCDFDHERVWTKTTQNVTFNGSVFPACGADAVYTVYGTDFATGTLRMSTESCVDHDTWLYENFWGITCKFANACSGCY